MGENKCFFFAKIAYIQCSQFGYPIRGKCRVQEKSKMTTITEKSIRQARTEIYSCSFCNFIQETIHLESLDPVDERKYLFHLKQAHGLVP